MGFKSYYGGYSHAWLFLGICILLKLITGSICCGTGDSESSCEDLSNDIEGTLTCDFGHADGSTCTFECSRPGYSVCPACPLRWTCSQGSWLGGILPSCCDTEPPTITCPESMTKFAAPNSMSAVVSWNTPQVSDNSGETITSTIVSGKSPGSLFEEGQHNITYQACDAEGNIATCSFNVTVEVMRCEALPARSEQYMYCSNFEDNFTYGSRCSFRCIPGCCLVGSSSISCENSGTFEPKMSWTDEQPTCRFVQCPAFLPPANGYFDGSCYTTYGSTCRIGCSSGYVLVGSSTRQCLAPFDESSCLGVWSEEKPECRVGDTDPPVFSGPHRIVLLAEERSLVAEVDYSWEPVKATDIVSGIVIATLVSIDSIPVVNDDARPSSLYEGVHRLVYRARDEAANVMLFTMELVVEVLRCETIDRPSNLTTSCSHANILGSSCSFRCLSGLCVVGSSSVICENVGNSTHPVGVWSDDQPTCQYVHCPELPMPFNGHFVDGQCTTLYEDICNMTCNLGFSLTSGNRLRQCQAIVGSACNAGFWDGQHPRCEDTTPPEFPRPQLIYLLAERQQTFANVIYNWEPFEATDYVSGQVVAKLVSVNGEYSNFKPTTLSEGLHILEYEAEDGAGNKALGIVPVVVTAARCPEIAPGSFQTISCSHENLYGSTCTFTCSTGKCLTGSHSATCFCNGNPEQPRGEWDNPPPTCQPATFAGCTELRPPLNGYLVTESCSSTNGSTCEVACNPGYHFQDGFSIRKVQCLVDDNVDCNEGYWRGSSTCHDIEKPQFTECQNHTIYAIRNSLSAYVELNVVATDNSEEDPTISCNMTAGTKPEGVYNLECSATDAAGNEAICNAQITVRVRRCQPTVPVLPPHGYVNTSYTCDNHFGGGCRIRCEANYELKGSNQALCEYDDELGHAFWSWIEPPVCENTATHCSPLLDELPFGVGLACSSSNSVGSYCAFYCLREGYALRGISVALKCEADSSWNVDVDSLQPRCEDIQPPSIEVYCPRGPIYEELSQETLNAEVHFVVPQASDNSQTLRMETTPPNITSPYNFDRDTVVTYTFVDEAGYSVSCSFQVIIENNLPPTNVHCHRSEDLQFDSPNDVVWQKPQFNNPVTGEAIDPICNRQPGDDLQPGVNTITCTATNPDNNISSQCEFNITVGARLCEMLPTVDNGEWASMENTCTLICAPNHDVKYGEQTVFTYGENGWLPPVTDVPLCQEYSLPNKLKQSCDASYISNMDCSGTTVKTTLENDVKDFVDECSLGEPCHDMCGIDGVTVDCEEAEPISRRKRSEPSVYLMLACFSLEIDVPETATATDLDNDKDAMNSFTSKVSREIEDDQFHPNVANLVLEPRSVEVGEIVPICDTGLTRAKHKLACVPCDASSEGQTSCEP